MSDDFEFIVPFDDTQLPFTEDERLEQEEDAREDAGLDVPFPYYYPCVGDEDEFIDEDRPY